jgi:phosphatidylethanolamine N-methyltransferase
MVSQLLSPTQPKNKSDLIVLCIMALHILAYTFLPSSLRIPLFAATFLFWRASYNVGIGYLLRVQSDHSRMVTWAKRSGLFEKPVEGKSAPWLRRIIKAELEAKIPVDYSFDDAPIEYNAWLVFRRLVDLILMCDFLSYCLFACANATTPTGEFVPVTAGRWIIGLGLVGFNLWVKLDAHRVVKDYAWYWGDFFYLIDQELTFDGVFEMAPHPMYSVGYAGYYGISLMAASYKVLFISLVAHAAQFAFLVLVENPHIDKTYNPPRKRRASDASVSQASTGEGAIPADQGLPTLNSIHNIIGLQNIDFYRITDSSAGLLFVYLFLFTVFTPSTPAYQALFFVNAIIWRLWYSIGIGYILNRQSNTKAWTRHFLKFGDDNEQAWRQWKGIYHISMVMNYASFAAAAFKVYTIPSDWSNGLVLLNHVLGVLLIALQVWTATSIYESLGEFGWFFGDFFFDHAPKLTYSGIYRYLNNPERVIGLAGVWGLALITGSRYIAVLALLSHVLTLAFLEFVERRHMEKLYGQSLRREAGLTKNLKRTLPPPLVKQWQGRVDKALAGAAVYLEDFFESAGPRVSSGFESVKYRTTMLSKFPVQLTLSTAAADLAGIDTSAYYLEIEHNGKFHHKGSIAKQSEASRSFKEESSFRSLVIDYGSPIRIRWRAPRNHSPKDWIGIYKVSDNASRNVTGVPSAGRWIATTPHIYQSSTSDKGILLSDITPRKDSNGEVVEGEVKFEGDKLWWTQGVFEFRYHHNGNHHVMAISLPFEVKIPRVDDDMSDEALKAAAERALLPIVRNCLGEDDDFPATADEEFGYLIEQDERYAKRIVYAVQHMFGIEFAPEVVRSDGNVSRLAWRICNAKKVLAPYSMSSHGAPSTPGSMKQHAILDSP